MTEPDYDKYSLEELYDAKANINELASPERLKKINVLIQEKEQILETPVIKNNNFNAFTNFAIDKTTSILGFGIPFLIFISVLIVVLIIQGPSEESLLFRNTSIHSKVDSLIYFKPLQAKKHFILVEGTWYILSAKYYGYFYNYLAKGDSIAKAPGRWDIYVYKKQNGKLIEKYFKGAQDDWE